MQYQHEQAYLLVKGNPEVPANPPPDVIPWSYTGNRLHPTQKPTGIFTPLLEAFTKPGDVVLDPFAGSGSTLVAARDLGRQFVGIELDETHQRTASTRLASKFHQPGFGQSRFRQPTVMEPAVSKFHHPDTAVDVHDAVPFVAQVPRIRRDGNARAPKF